MTRQHPEVWGAARSVDACIDRWLKDVALSRRYAGRRNYLIVRYEALVADLEACLRELLAFIGLPFADAVLSDYPRASGRVVASGETWKASVREEVRDTRSRKFERVFTPQKQAYVLERIRAHTAQPSTKL